MQYRDKDHKGQQSEYVKWFKDIVKHCGGAIKKLLNFDVCVVYDEVPIDH